MFQILELELQTMLKVIDIKYLASHGMRVIIV